jgi:2-dehydropantoate 2-reductase
VREIVAVSRAVGVSLSDRDEANTIDALHKLPPAMKPSFLLDLERGGSNELDVLAGAVHRLGRMHGVPTPVHDVATAAFTVASTS